MVHVTFSEKVECHQYSPTGTHPSNDTNDNRNHAEVASSSARGQARVKYDRRFLKSLRKSPISQVCPEFVKKGIEENKSWTGSDPLPIPSGRAISKGNTFYRQPNNYISRQPRRQFVPFYTNNQENFPGHFGPNHMNMYEPIAPIGSNRYSTQSRNYQGRNSLPDYADNFSSGGNLLPDFALHRHDMKKTNDDDAEPEWYRSGPTSPNDCIELHGFEGPGHQENPENHATNDQLGSVDGNISGGPTSGASSNNGSPPAKSTPAKVTFCLNDTPRNKRPAVGRSNNWQNNFENRQSGAPFLNELFKNFSGQPNLRVLTPIESVEDIESALLYDRLKFRQMVAQLQTQNLCRNLMYQQKDVIPSASQILSEIDIILRTNPDPVIKRPEVRALIKNIVEAVIPPLNIMNLLKSPMTEPHNRETIHTALKLITQAKQNAINTIKMHKPTESELRAHMDAIMQDAIIKKKMENLNNELMKGSFQQGVRNLSNQTQFQQLFRQNTAGRFENHSQSDYRGQCQSFENGPTSAQENLNRWFSPTLLNKGLSGELPQIPSNPLRSEELESKIKRKLIVNEKEVK